MHSAFALPIWEFDLSGALADGADSLEADCRRAIVEIPAPNTPASQSAPRLAAFSSAWACAFATIDTLVTRVLRQFYPTTALEITGRKEWAVRLVGADQRSPGPVHSHAPATLSTILYVHNFDTPAGMSEPDLWATTGTRFFSPLMPLVRYTSAPHAFTSAGRPWTLMVFPSWMDHVPMTGPEGATGDRLSVAADFYSSPKMEDRP